MNLVQVGKKTEGADRDILVPPSSGEFLHIAYLLSVEKVFVFVKDRTGSYHAIY